MTGMGKTVVSTGVLRSGRPYCGTEYSEDVHESQMARREAGFPWGNYGKDRRRRGGRCWDLRQRFRDEFRDMRCQFHCIQWRREAE